MQERQRHWRSGFGALALLMHTGVASAQSVVDLADVRACMQANLPAKTLTQRVQLSSDDRVGNRQTLIGDLYGQRVADNALSLMLAVLQPTDLSGARYLLVHRQSRDDMYVYLPALDRVRRVMGGLRGQPLWGTDFSYEDIRHLFGTMADAPVSHAGEAMRDGRPVHRLTLQLNDAPDSLYVRLEVDVDQRSCLILTTRFFDHGGLIKTLRSDPASFVQIGEHWVYGQVTMHNHRAETMSELRISDVNFDRDLPSRLFHPRHFQEAG